MARAHLISAALRHVRDAEHLLEPGPHQSVEQALHLVGFGPECARKACLDESLADKALGHDIKGAGDPVVDFLLAIDPSASRYRIEDQHAEVPLHVEHWNVGVRYLMKGQADQARVRALVEEARRFVDRCVTELWCDGALPSEALR